MSPELTAIQAPLPLSSQPGFFNRHARAFGLLTVLTVGGVACSSSRTSNPEVTPAAASKAAAAECADLTFTDAAANAANYDSDAFLPKASKLSNPNDVSTYVSNLFGRKGPLAGNGDKASLAEVMATIVDPARAGGTNPSYNYSTAFGNAQARYAAAGGHDAAVEDCKAASTILDEVGGFNAAWVQPGTVVTEFVPVRDKANRITDMRANTIVEDHVLAGAVFAYNGTTKGLKGFNEVFVGPDGTTYVKGAVQLSTGKNKADNSGQAQATTEQQQPSGNGTSQSNNPNQGGSTGESSSSTAGSGNGEAAASGAGAGNGGGGGGTGPGAGNGTRSGGSGSGSNGISGGGKTPEGAPGGSDQTPSQGLPGGTGAGKTGTTTGTAPTPETPPATAPPVVVPAPPQITPPHHETPPPPVTTPPPSTTPPTTEGSKGTATGTECNQFNPQPDC